MLLKNRLPDDDLQKIIGRYDLGEVLKAEPILSSGNISYLIDSSKGKFFLRLCPDGFRFRTKEEVSAELELIDHLLKNNFPAPVTVAQKNGEVILEYQGKYGYLRRYNESEAILEPTLAQVGQFGETLGWFHSLIEGYKSNNSREHIFDLEETKKNLEEDKEMILRSKFKNTGEFVEKVEIELAKLNFPDDLPKGMIHEDLGKRHVLWQNGKISLLVDFDRSYYGKLILDLGQAARGWCFVDDWSAWSNKNFQALISGYQKKRKLTQLEKELLLDAVKFGVLERGISFCLRFIEVTGDPKDEDFAWKSAFDFLKMLEDNREELNKVLGL